MGSRFYPALHGAIPRPAICENWPVPAAPTGAYRRYALVYDLVWRAAPYDRFVDLCLETAAAQGTRVRRVLVAACGTGSAAAELARRGLEVTGFDLSPSMVAVAATKLRGGSGGPSGWSSGGSGLRLVVGDLRAVPVRDGWADLVLALNTSLNYLLEPAQVVAALAHMGRVAAPGGTVVVEPLSRRFVHDGWEPGRHVDRDGLRLDATYEVEGDLVVERLRWSFGGLEESETYRQRLYGDAQLEALIGAAGLRLAERRPMWPAIPAEPARGRTLWVARPAG
jgi:SAM-dependent methyltransferase